MSLKFKHQVCYMLLKCVWIYLIWKPCRDIQDRSYFLCSFLCLRYFFIPLLLSSFFSDWECPVHFFCPCSLPLCILSFLLWVKLLLFLFNREKPVDWESSDWRESSAWKVNCSWLPPLFCSTVSVTSRSHYQLLLLMFLLFLQIIFSDL